MRVAVIGAGAAGLSSARHIAAAGLDCDVLEMNSQLGGTWVYTDDVGKDQYGFPVYSAMYQGLMTNLPKEVMGFPDFPVPEQDKSYLTQAEILQFLNNYADYFDIRKLIKFNRMVQTIKPLAGNRWEVTSVDKPSKEVIKAEYDAVMICNGHYNDPFEPEILGREAFKGEVVHSHNYRSPKEYEGKRVLVVGAGPSGLDIALQVSKKAQYVVLSHHSKEAARTHYPSNVTKRPDIFRILDEEQVEFVDGSCCAFDVICLCTGYHYSFPFLDPECGITVDENHIQPLYKHMVHVDRPTMAFIGIPFNVCAFQMFDLQARYYTKYLSGSMSLLPSDMMRAHMEADIQARQAKGYTKRQMHMMGPDQRSYYEDLAADADTKPIAPVIIKLRDQSVKNLYDDLLNFRSDRYKIVDEETFIKVH